MKNKNKIDAFTLNEVILAMVISIIVVGMAFTVLVLIQKQMTALRANFQETESLNKLNELLWIDFNKHEKIIYTINTNELTFKINKDSIVYTFKEDKIIRNTDTLNIKIESIYTFFDTKKSVYPIDAIKLKAKTNKRYNSLFIYKQNDAYQYLN